jgi:hypothetical protein
VTRVRGAFAVGKREGDDSPSPVLFKVENDKLRYNSGYGWKDLESIASRHKTAWLWAEIYKHPESTNGRDVALGMVDGHGLALDEAKGLSNWPFILAERCQKENIDAPEHSFAQLEIVHFRGGPGAYAPLNWGGSDMEVSEEGSEYSFVLGYVPELEEIGLSWAEALDLADECDERAAYELAFQFEG